MKQIPVALKTVSFTSQVYVEVTWVRTAGLKRTLSKVTLSI